MLCWTMWNNKIWLSETKKRRKNCKNEVKQNNYYCYSLLKMWNSLKWLFTIQCLALCFPRNIWMIFLAFYFSWKWAETRYQTQIKMKPVQKCRTELSEYIEFPIYCLFCQKKYVIWIREKTKNKKKENESWARNAFG